MVNERGAVLLVFFQEGLIVEQQSVCFEILVDGVFEVFSEVSLNVCVDCRPTECQYRHLPCLQILFLAVEFVGDKEGELLGRDCEYVSIWSFYGFPIEGDHIAMYKEGYLWWGCFFLSLILKLASLQKRFMLFCCCPISVLNLASILNIARYYNIINIIGMYYIKTLFSPRTRHAQQENANNIFYELNVLGNCRLHKEYHHKLKPYLNNIQTRSKCFKMLVSKLQELQNVESIIKLLAVIHNTIIEFNYADDLVECLENLQLVSNRSFNFHDKEQEGWFKPFYRAYIFYLAKIPSISEIFCKIADSQKDVQPLQLVIIYFRLVNQLNILLLPLSTVINVIGRYYLKKILAFQDLYDVIKKELMKVYEFLKVILKRIFCQFEQVNSIELSAFLDSIPEFQIMIDKFQDIITSKYYRGVGKYNQLYIKQQNVAQLIYYLSSSKSKKQAPLK